MARYIGPACKLCRRENSKLFLKGDRCYTDKCAFDRRPYPPGVHGQRRNKPTEYGVPMREKQKVRRVYGILERQRRSAYRVSVDAAELDVGVTFDFVVLRDGRELIAEVKTGSLVTRLRHAETRRQLLEYQLVSGREAVLLVDPERACITEVSFPLPDGVGAPEVSLPTPQPRGWVVWAWVLALAVGACALWYRSG